MVVHNGTSTGIGPRRILEPSEGVHHALTSRRWQEHVAPVLAAKTSTGRWNADRTLSPGVIERDPQDRIARLH